MGTRFEGHSHSIFSNVRLLDSINKVEDLIDYAIEIGLSGIALTDHDCLSGSIRADKYRTKAKEKNPDFKIALGNEIYLCKDRSKNQKYYHFILIAKKAKGHRLLRELSSKAWLQSYYDRGMERVVTTYDDLEEIVNRFPDSIIATNACAGGQLAQLILELTKAENEHNDEKIDTKKNEIVDFIFWCKKLFGDDFYLEIAPGQSKEQIIINKRMKFISKTFNIPILVNTDAHFLKKEDRYAHESYLNSKDGEREVASFYEYAYLQTNEEIIENLTVSGYLEGEIAQLFQNSMEVYDKIEEYTLAHKQQIPYEEIEYYEPIEPPKEVEQYPILSYLYKSEDNFDRYWVNQCYNSLLKEESKGWMKKEEHNRYLERLEEEADVKKYIGDKLETNIFRYPILLQKYIDLFWESGSIIGPARGSAAAGLNHYLLGINQLQPLDFNFPFFRYLNKERAELPDIDIDICPSKRPYILQQIKEKRKNYFNEDLNNLFKENLGCTLVATFGTETAKSVVLSAARGYRSEEYPDGIDNDTAQYIASLIASERGFLWSINDLFYGNKEKGRKPNQAFINEVESFPGLKEIILKVEGVINKRSSHASGVIMFDGDPFEHCCFMRTPKGEIITQWDLHDAEYCGNVKIDMLVTEVEDRIKYTIDLLQKYNKIEKDLSLREAYNKYFHPRVLPLKDKNIWKKLHEGSVISTFQFDTLVGSQAAKKIKPDSIFEMSEANSLMRLMPEEGQESPMDKYIRFKNNINLWYKEMEDYNLTKEEQKILEPHLKPSYGVISSQESVMLLLMDKNICNFSLAEGNTSRKLIAKKQMDKIPELREKVFKTAKSKNLGKYIWDKCISPELGYSFSVLHSTAYSYIGFQTLYAATKWNPVYWNTACLVVNSGSLDEENSEQCDYKKTAKALGEILSRGIDISLIDINKSNFTFEPDEENNQILFGMNALKGINAEIIKQIIKNRPYNSFKEFLIKCPLGKISMISLIKAGAFDKFADREFIMAYYIQQISEPKNKLTLQNFEGLLKNNLVPNTEELNFCKDIYQINKIIKYYKYKEFYYVTDRIVDYINNSKIDNKISFYEINNKIAVSQKEWNKYYTKVMEPVRFWLKEDQEILNKINYISFKNLWDKYAEGSISAWEMDSLCFYYHEHELARVDKNKYGISLFSNLRDRPVEMMWKKTIPIYKLSKIIGTVIAKDDTKSIVTLLCIDGVVNVKFSKSKYAYYNRQLSDQNENGTKTITEKSWFTRGTKLLVAGYKRDDTFVLKVYSRTPFKDIYKIIDISKDGKDILLQHDREGVE